ALREHQGGPRGTAGPRSPVPAGAPVAQPARRRLAADDVPDARRPAPVLWWHLFSPGPAPRPAGLLHVAAAGRRLLPRSRAGTALERDGRGARLRRTAASAPGRNARARRDTAASLPAATRAQLRSRMGRLRRCAQIPARAAGAARPARLARERARRRAGPA